jgi:hypothetical protein
MRRVAAGRHPVGEEFLGRAEGDSSAGTNQAVPAIALVIFAMSERFQLIEGQSKT